MIVVNPSAPFSLSGLAIRRAVGTLMLTLTVMMLGTLLITQLPVDLLPAITYPRIGVRLDAPGISPEVAVDEITRPLEEGLAATEGVVQIFSQTREGRVSVDLFFEPGGDVDQALNDATATFNRVRNRLPDTLEQPRIFKFDPSQLPVYEFAITSPSLQGSQLRVFADTELARELVVVSGVAAVDVTGAADEEVQVNVDLERLQSYGLGLNTVLTAIAQRNQDISGGRITGTDQEFLSRTMGQFNNVDELRTLPLVPPGAESRPLVYLQDFAQIIDGTEDQRVFAYLNGAPAIKVSVQKQPDANTVEVIRAVKARMEELRKSGLIPDDLLVIPTLDESIFIGNAIYQVVEAGVSGSLLAGLVVFLFLGSLRQTLIIMLAMPLSTMVALTFMGLFGLSLNIFSLGGLALGVGNIIDNAIVMMENLTVGAQTLRAGTWESDEDNGGPPRIPQRQWLHQAEASSRELESALLASTTTNLASVVPFLLVGGFFSLLFNELILTIIFSVAASLVIALTVVPALTTRLIRPEAIAHQQTWGFLGWIQRGLDALTASYRRSLGWVLGHRYGTVGLALLILGGGSLWMGPQIPQEILPRIGTGQANLSALFPAGTPLADNQQVMAAATGILLEQPETTYVFSTVGGQLFGSSTTENPLRSNATITLAPGTDTEAYTERVSDEIKQLNLVDVRLRINPQAVRGLILTNSPTRGSDIDIVLQGKDPDILAKAGRQVLKALDEGVTLARFRPDADPRQNEVQISPDWERAAALGLNATTLGETIQTALLGSVASQLQRDDRLVDIRVQLDQAAIQNPEQLKQLPLLTGDRQPVQLGNLADIRIRQAPGEIQRINQRPVFIMVGNLAEDANLSDATAQVKAVLNQFTLPEGVSLAPSATEATNRQLQEALILLGSLSVFLVFVVMAVQYNSLVDPLVILLTVPLALSGGILGLYITETAMGATVLIGAVLLVGIVVNNAIIMVELANQIRQQQPGLHPQEAILIAAPRRLRPILMTSITTVIGLLPLALGQGEGSEFLRPLGIVVFYGLSLATLLTLFMIPCFYSLLHGFGPSSRPPRRKVLRRQPEPSLSPAPLQRR